MRTYGTVDVLFHVILASALTGSQWSAHALVTLHQGRGPLRGRGVGPGVGLDDVEKRKFFTLPGLELRPLGRPARSLWLYRRRCPCSVYVLYLFCYMLVLYII
jgi:hypothetical protein